MTEIEERRRRQAVRVLITEVFMGAVIIVLVAILALVAAGYNLNFGGEIEHAGLVQLGSIPSGAAIEVDGEGIFMPTNQSRTMKSGEHTIAYAKDGYSNWSKTITVTESMLYRLNYPRLYRLDRQRETIDFLGVLRDRYPDVVSFTISSAKVNADFSKLQLRFAEVEGKELTVHLNDGRVELSDLPAVAAAELKSRVMIEKIAPADEAVAATETDLTYRIYVRQGDELALVRESAADKVLALAAKYYGDDYLAIVEDDVLTVYMGTLPRAGEKLSKRMKVLVREELDFVPAALVEHGEGQLIAAIGAGAEQMAIHDAEDFALKKVSLGAPIGWLSNFDIYTVIGGALHAYDFDGENGFEIAGAELTVDEALPAAISENNRYIYYFTTTGELIRENIR